MARDFGREGMDVGVLMQKYKCTSIGKCTQQKTQIHLDNIYFDIMLQCFLIALVHFSHDN